MAYAWRPRRGTTEWAAQEIERLLDAETRRGSATHRRLADDAAPFKVRDYPVGSTDWAAQQLRLIDQQAARKRLGNGGPGGTSRKHDLIQPVRMRREPISPELDCAAVCARGIPPAPPGVDMQANIGRARKMSLLDAGSFYDLVKTGGPWDYKQLAYPTYEEFGNFHFGATGTAVGFPDWVLKRAAGWAQEDSSPHAGHWYWEAPYGDDPRDQVQIQRGIEFYHCGCPANMPTILPAPRGTPGRF
jgi:hypothetical protein